MTDVAPITKDTFSAVGLGAMLAVAGGGLYAYMLASKGKKVEEMTKEDKDKLLLVQLLLQLIEKNNTLEASVVKFEKVRTEHYDELNKHIIARTQLETQLKNEQEAHRETTEVWSNQMGSMDALNEEVVRLQAVNAALNLELDARKSYQSRPKHKAKRAT